MLRTFRSRWAEGDDVIAHPTASNEEAKTLYPGFKIRNSKMSKSTPAGDGAAGPLTGIAIEGPLVLSGKDPAAEVYKAQNCLQSRSERIQDR